MPSKRAWETSVLFDNNVCPLDQKLHGTRILLVVENSAAHPRDIEGLQNVEPLFPTYHDMKKSNQVTLG